jgi:gluconate 5-dehydrogenase
LILDKFSLKGRSGIVTGGGTALGKRMATALIQAGAELVIVGRRTDLLKKRPKK